MRWVFWILVLCNVGLAGWHFLAGGQAAPPQPDVAQSAPVAAGVKPLKLWSELSADEKAVLAGGASGGGNTAADEKREPGADTAATPAGPLCDLVGPFADEVTAKQVIQRLRAVDVEPAMYMLDVTTGTDYWVHVGPFDTRREALDKLKKVQKSGIDSYLITNGPLANAVSLGMFSKREAAERLQAKRSKQGLNPQITALPHKVRQRWLVFKAADAARVGADFWQGLARDFAGVVRKESYCSDIASADEVD